MGLGFEVSGLGFRFKGPECSLYRLLAFDSRPRKVYVRKGIYIHLPRPRYLTQGKEELNPKPAPKSLSPNKALMEKKNITSSKCQPEPNNKVCRLIAFLTSCSGAVPLFCLLLWSRGQSIRSSRLQIQHMALIFLATPQKPVSPFRIPKGPKP